MRKAVTAFIDATREDVQLALITLAERPTILVGYTTDRAALRKAADNMFAYEAGNYLLDGIAETSQGLAKRTMWRSAIAVITGRRTRDELSPIHRSAALLSRGRRVAPRRAGGRAASAAKGARSSSARERPKPADASRKSLVPTSLELKSRQLATELSNQYRVTYARPSRLVPPSKTEVSVRRPDLRARGMLLKRQEK